MRTVIVQVEGGVAEVTHEPGDVFVWVVDWDNINDSTSEERKADRDRASKILSQELINEDDIFEALELLAKVSEEDHQ